MSAAVKKLKHFETPKAAGVYYRLVCLTGKNKGLAYYIVGNRVVLGRSEKADVRVHDIKSSREHAEIVKVGKDYMITDLGSQNGVVVNDLKIKQHSLNDDDKVIIGTTVYKFGSVEVKDQEKPQEKEPVASSESFDEELPPQKSKLTPILAVVAILAIALLFLDDSPAPKVEKSRSKANYQVNEVSDPFISSLKQKRSEDKKNKEKLNIYFQKGLREFREGNYFRAISEFEHALSWSPNDGLAQFYLRKTKEALDGSIEEMFIKAKRDEESLKYHNAAISYCGILRLLYRYPEDERYINAKESISKVEEKLGMEDGQISCAEEVSQ
ncbi:MAG: FHA domain-containing protein [Bacteriovoracaceae bacterium]|nr:FHA domain-containing protein [Bacteriovoracaceae bacterium]